ncbi:condensin subunit ScpA [Thalassoporum mexicanum PCC 7367]|uniref:segregation/condensation protein A n=1 Tax=Thalassoporum mexicanum TaxID=3457544 RepID=UPI00029FF093|nr:segregation/condensation protein A [Pseudanabaena sp. PCC 7367]AFY70797.1 condensin subunit ScpA [Pseudanabaena sp. PCC 7367]
MSVTDTVTKEAIAMLIDLAEQGEIDPWDVQVIDVVDRFLSRLIDIRDDRHDLYESGQAILYASMLVLLKANSLSDQPMNFGEEEIEEAGELDWDETDTLAELPRNLENHIKRRPVAVPPQNRRITLNELIEQLEAISVMMEEGTQRRSRPRPPKQSRRAAMKAIAQLAHKENLSEMAIALEDYFVKHQITRTEVSTLAEAFNDKVGVFWALLLLSAQSKVELFQTDFYAAIEVVPIQNAYNGDARIQDVS